VVSAEVKGLDLIAGVRPAAPVWACCCCGSCCSSLITTNLTWRSLSAPEIGPCGLSEAHIKLKAEQRGEETQGEPPGRSGRAALRFFGVLPLLFPAVYCCDAAPRMTRLHFDI
ncbi:hypothetical protein KUCAC02_021457, partial [Chaenocephalus aceratus]